MLLMIVGGFAVVFVLSCLPGIVTHDAISHELNTGDAMMFNPNGSIKDSVWSWDLMTRPESETLVAPPTYQPVTIQGDLQTNPFAD